MAHSTGTNPGLVQKQIASFLVAPLQSASVVLAAGPTIVDSSVPVSIPYLGTSSGVSGANWVGELEMIPEGYTVGDNTEKVLLPTERKSLKTLSKVSNELARMSNPAISAMVQTRVVEDVRNALDEEFLHGDGTDNRILGIYNQADAERTTDFDPSEPDAWTDAVLDFASRNMVPNRFLLSHADYAAISKKKDSTGRYLLEPDISKGGGYTLKGIPATVSDRIQRSALVDFSQIVVVRDLDARVSLHPDMYANQDAVGIRQVSRWDIGTLRPGCIQILDTASE